MKPSRHIHKYKRKELGRKTSYIVYACMLPNCSHYLRRELMVGKESICWKCGEVFTLTHKNVGTDRQVKPKCPKCMKWVGTVSIKNEDMSEVIDSIFKGVLEK